MARPGQADPARVSRPQAGHARPVEVNNFGPRKGPGTPYGRQQAPAHLQRGRKGSIPTRGSDSSEA
eukprot:2845272-Pyramimonas_sp.AAC.1